MKNKQILKIGRKKKIALAAMAGVVLTGAMTGTAFASNWGDTTYNFHCSAAGGTTESRAKEDNSYVYIYHQGTVGVQVQVKYNGDNYTGHGGVYEVQVGEQKYMVNWIYEEGLPSCYLYLTPVTDSSTWLYGKWSPDSI